MDNWKLEFESASSQIGRSAKIDEILEATSHPFCELNNPVYGLDSGRRQAGLKVGEDSLPMLTDSLGQGTERLQPAAQRPAAPSMKLTLSDELIRAGINGLQRLA